MARCLYCGSSSRHAAGCTRPYQGPEPTLRDWQALARELYEGFDIAFGRDIRAGDRPKIKGLWERARRMLRVTETE